MSVAVDEETIVRTGYAPKYKVMCHDDPVTTMDFVVLVLVDVFRKSQQDAIVIMTEVHKTGVALVDVMPLEEAEFRVEKAEGLSRAAGYPLKFTYEPE